MRNVIHILAVLSLVAIGLGAQATAPSTAVALPEGPLEITVTGVEGMVQVRAAPGEAWQRALEGMKLAEGAEFRTGPKSAVRFTIGTDQTFTLDRLGTVQVLRANFENGKINTDVGMKYGRTRYDIDTAEREHDTKVRSPSSVLAVRGTRVSLYDQPPFAPQAVSLTGRAMFRDLKKQIAFGGVGKARVGERSDSAADQARQDSFADPRGTFAGRTEADYTLQLSLAAYGGTDFSNLGVLALLDAARAGDFQGSITGALPVGRQLAFNLFWFGDSFSDVDLTVTSPLGEIVSIASPQVPSSGRFLGADGSGTNGIADESGFGQESIAWEISYPPGTYNVRVDLRRGTEVNATVVAIDDPQNQGIQAGVITGPLTQGQPNLTGTVTVPVTTPTGIRAQSVSSKSPAKPKPTPATKPPASRGRKL